MERFFTRKATLGRPLALFAAAAFVLSLAVCSNPSGGGEPKQFTITFDSQGGSDVAVIIRDEGTAVPKPVDPAREGYAFLGWHSAGGEPYTWPHALTGDVIMYARWEPALEPGEQQAVDDFKNNEAVKEALAQDPGEIGLDAAEEDLAAIEAALEEALEAYRDLPGKAQEALAEEKVKLEAIKEKIENVNAAHDFQDSHGEALGKSPDDLTGLEDAAALLPELEQALEAAKALPAAAQELLKDDIERLEELKEKAEEIVDANADDTDKAAAHDFREAHGTILSKTAETVSLSDEDAVDAALQDYAALGGVAKALLVREYEQLSGFKQKIEALKPVPDITYTAAANGSADTVSSTEIALAFSAAVSGLTAEDISIVNGTGSADKGALAGSGQNWTLGIRVAAAGTLTVSINKAGIEGAEKTVTLHKAPPALGGTVAVTGSALVGQALTANIAGLEGSGAISYQWQRGDSANGSFADISGAAASSYTLATADLGKYIRITVRRAGYSGTASSSAVGPIDIQKKGIALAVGFNNGEIEIDGSDEKNVISKSGSPNSIALTADSRYSNVAWHIDGSETAAGSENSITLNASDYDARPHSVTFTGTLGGNSYSRIIPFTVIN
jgi:tetratricopeptide (TPR) repeat protein